MPWKILIWISQAAFLIRADAASGAARRQRLAFNQGSANFVGVEKHLPADFDEGKGSLFLLVANPAERRTAVFRPNGREKSGRIYQLFNLHFISDATCLIARWRVRNCLQSTRLPLNASKIALLLHHAAFVFGSWTMLSACFGGMMANHSAAAAGRIRFK